MNDLEMMKAWLGMSPELPYYKDIEDPQHGQKAKNDREVKIIYDAEKINKVTGKPGVWVSPNNFSGRKPLTIRGNGFIYTNFGIFSKDDPEMEHPLTMDDVYALREAKRDKFWRDKLAAEGITSDTDVFEVNGVKVKGAKYAWHEFREQTD